MGCHAFPQEIFLTQGSNPGLMHYRQILCSEPLALLKYYLKTFYHSNHIWKKQRTRVYNEIIVYCRISPSPNSISQEESLLFLFQGFLMVTSLILKNEPLLLFLDLLVNHSIKMRRFVPLFFHVFSSVFLLLSVLVPLLSNYKGWHLYFLWNEVKVTQLCLTLCDPMDCSPHGIFQARILEWVTFPFSRGSSQPRDWTQVSRTAGGFFTSWVTREAHIFSSNHN